MANDRINDLDIEELLDTTEFETLTENTDYAIRVGTSSGTNIDAGGGDDVVMTGSGNDIVRGGAGNDYIATGAGDDILVGGAGFNVLSGGTGRDTFVFDADDLGEPGAYAVNTVTDFNPEEDCLLLVGFGFTNFADIPAFVSPTGVMLQIAPNKIILLQNVFSLEELAQAVDLGQDPLPTPPAVTVDLTTDTGNPDDGVTSQIVLAGLVTNEAAVTSLLLSIDGGPEVDVTAALNEDGTYEIGADFLAGLDDGAHSFEVRAVDSAGQSSQVVSVSVTLDTTAPEIGTFALDPVSDTGILGDGLTNKMAVTVSGTAETGAILTLLGKSVVADSSGRFVFDGVVLTEGENLLTVVATDAAGNTSRRDVTVSRDSVGPALEDLALDPDSDDGVVGDLKTTVGAALIINGQTEAFAQVSVGDVTVTADDTGAFAINASPALLGDNALIVVSMDAAGNTTTRTITIIGEAPDLPVPDVQAELGEDSGHDPEDGITADLALVGSVSVTPSLLTISVGDGSAIDITDLLASDNTFSLSQEQLAGLFGTFSDGALSFSVTAQNADGQTGSAGIVDVIYDTTAPDVAIGLAPGFDSGELGDGLTNQTTVDLAGILSDSSPHILRVDGAEVVVASDGSFDLTNLTLAEGVNTFEVIAEDAAGNINSQVLIVNVDTVAPELFDLALDPDSDTGTQGDDATDLRNVTLTGMAEPGATVSIGNLSTVVADDGSFSLPGVPVALGTNTLTLAATDAAGNSKTASLDVEGTEPVADEPPIISNLELTVDTGSSPTDKITSNAGVSGSLASDAGVSALFLSINGGTPIDASSALSGTSFVIGEDLVAAAAGGTLPEGAFTLALVAVDALGQSSDAKSLTATLDSTTPGLSGLQLASSSDTGVSGDGITALRSVKIVGEGEAGSTVTSGAARTVVGVDGKFALNGVPVEEGDNTLTLNITDKAGNMSQSVLEVTGIQAVEGQPVLVWNDITLEAIADNAATPTGASRVLAMQSVAVYDVVAAIDDAPAFLVNEDALKGADLAAAIAQASYTVLSYAFPAFQAELDAYLAEALDGVPDGEGEDAGVALGQLIAERVIAIRDTDGWDDFEPYPGSDAPGEWRETGPMFNPAAAPQWATMETWALEDAEQFRANAPPDLNSAEYAASLASVREIGAAASTTRTADQTEAARFWKDGQGTETTPGHWNSIATDLMKDEAAGTGAAARALAMLNVSVADAMIAAWDTKYEYAFWRPVNAIRLADQDGNASTTADSGWTSMMLSPAHPEYVSGHAAASGAAAEVLTELFGTQSFTTESLGLVGVTRSFESYWQAAEENADSREWGGVHFDFSNESGLLLGAEVADWAIAAFNDQTDTAAPVIIVDVSFGYSSELPFAISGAALDTLSGVESLTASVNGDAPVALALESDGDFSFVLDQDTEDGDYTIAFRATDAVGNVSKTVQSRIVIDTADPELTLTSLTEGALSGSAARLTGTIDGTGAPIVALAYQIDGGKMFALSYNKTTGAFDSALNLSAVPQGESTVTVIAADAAGNSIREDFVLQIDEAIPFVVTSVMPDNLSDEVGSTFRPEIHFSRPVDPETVTTDSFYLKDASGKTIAANVRVSEDGLKAWLFPAEPMPGANTIKLTLRGDLITSLDGTLLDGDGDGADGGNLISSFTTVSTTAVANTSISGFIIDPGADLKPMTTDDYSAGPDGIDYTEDDVFLSPIVGAKVFILGLEHITVTTDENGYFALTNVPAGNVKVAVDGRTATNSPDGVFWPEMVMDANIVAGQANTLMAAMNSGEQRDALTGRGEVYLPRVSTEILQDLSETEATEIGMPVSAAQDLTAEQRSQIKLVVQPGSAVDENGNPVEDAQVGISTVPAELVMDMLPAGLMQHTFDLTIQAPDSAVFTTPAELTLPNVFDAAPGTKLNLLSFDHTTGRLVIEGTGTVSADGLTVTTDPGTGITKPGWHGMTPPGGNGCNGGDPLQPDEEDPDVPDPEEAEVDVLALYSHDGEGGILFKREWKAPDELPETPPDPSGDEDCPKAAEDVGDKEQPWINVKIAIDGPLADFVNKEGNIGIASTEFTLRAGTNAERGFAFSMQTFEEMFGAGGIKNIDKNILYGSKITITERTQDADGNQTVTKEDIFVTRYVDATDKNHVDATTEAASTVADGAAGNYRQVDLEIRSGSDVPEVSITNGTTDFYWASSQNEFWFDPITGNTTGQVKTGEATFTAAGHDLGSIALKGKAYAKEKYYLDDTTLNTVLTNIDNDSDKSAYPTINDTQRGLLDTAAERTAILDKIAEVTAKHFADAGLDSAIEHITTNTAGSLDIKFVEHASMGKLGGATNAFGTGAQVLKDIAMVVKDRTKYNDGELSFRFAEEINETLGGDIAFYLDNFFELSLGTRPGGPKMDTLNEIGDAMGMNSAHEIGHHLGLVHTLQNNLTPKLMVAGGADDLMAQGLYLTDTQSFDETKSAAKIGLHMSWEMSDITDSIDYYKQALARYGLSVNNHEVLHVEGFHGQELGLSNVEGDISEDAGAGTLQPGELFADESWVLLSDGLGTLLGPVFDLGEVVVDGLGEAVATEQLLLTNIGGVGTTIADVLLGDGMAGLTFDLTEVIGAELAPMTEFGFGLAFDPLSAGAVSQDITILLASGEEYTTTIQATGILDSPSLSIMTENSNFGGVDRGDLVSESEMFTITNDGLQNLVIDGIALDAGAASFSLLGVPTDIATSPITLARGETFTFGVSFTGVNPGLSRGAITISSNDPASPVTKIAASATSFEGAHFFGWGNDFIAIDINGETLRTVSNEDGNFALFLPPEEDYKITVFDPDSGLVAINYGTTSVSGRGTDLTSGLVFRPSTARDADLDGLTDDIEHAVGTSTLRADSDGDGLVDFDEIKNGSDPLSGFVTTTGVVDTLPLSGTVEEIAITADIPGQATIALVASGSAGLSILSLSERTAPKLLAQYDTPGSAVDVSVDGQLALAAVATGSSIKIIDVSNPTDPQLVSTISESVSQIEVYSGRLYAADDGEILVYDLVTGDRLQREDLPSSASGVRAMTMESGLLYVIDNVNTLSVFDVVDDVLNLRGTLSLSGQSWAGGLRSDKLFASDGVLYVPADAGFNAGYATIDISDLENLSVLSGPDDRGLSGTDFADAGNGIGITVGRLGGVFGTNSVMVVNNSDPTQTDQFVTRYDLDAAPTTTVVSAGFVYVGDAAGNFHVINALGFDTNGVAPNIAFEPLDIDVDPAMDGIQIEEGTDVRLPINLTDDVQIQKVELLVNGAVVRTDLSIPYDLKFRVPNLADGITQGTFQVRATDTGGNIAVSEAIQFDIIEDITPPEIIRLTPSDGGLTLVDGTTVRVVFNEAIDTNSVSTALATLEGGGGQVIEAVTLNILGSDRIVQFDFGTLDLGPYTLSVDLTSVTDLAGNALGASAISQTLEVVDATAVWTDPSGGDWSDLAKWRDGVLPTDTDGVALVLNEGSTVVYRNLNTEVERIVLTGKLDVQSGTLQAGLIEGNNGVLRTSGGTLKDTTIDGGEGFSAGITGGTWSNVDLLVDGFVGDGSQFVNWYVQEGLTVGGDLELTGSGRYAYMRLQGDQTVDGDGTIRLNDAQSYIYLQSLDSTARETVVFGPDLSIEGQGQIWTQRPEDWFQILGDVTAVGGALYLGDIDNGGETLSLDSAGGGWIDINRVTTNTVFDVAEGADVRITSGTHSDLTLGGAGATRIQNATVNGLTVTGEAEIEGTTVNASGQLYVNEDLTVDGTLGVAGTQQRTSYTYVSGEQTVDGSGEILLSRANAIGDEGLSGRNFVQLQSQFSTERETLTFGEDLTIRGDGTVTTNRAEDRIQILGDVAGIAGGNLILERIDNAGETLTVDATTGAVSFRSLVENTVVNGTGEVGLEANVRIEDVTFNMDARIGSATGYDYASVDDGLTLNAALELASGTSRYAYLYVNGAQTIGGTGSIDLTRTNAPSGSFNNTISLQSQSADAEVLTFGADIEITGTGRLEANRAEDSLQILGTVAGRDGSLVLTDIDNQGEVLTVDASDGAVVLSERIENTVFAAATGQTGELTIGSGAYLDAVTLNIDTAFGGSYPQSYVENGLTLNSDLEISANPNTYAYLYFTGEQVIGGTGTIRLSDANAPLSNNIQNYVYLNGQLSGSEIVTISADMEITGEGFVRSGNSLDEFLVEGAIVADNGTLRADDIAALEGILGATSDGDLFLSEGIELTERGTLAVGLSGSGADVSNGQIRITGALEQKGTLALDVATDFDAEIGDEFVFMTTTQGFTGAFDDFQGFDLAGDKAFELIQKDANTLAIRVTTDAVAEAGGFINRAPFVPEARPAFEKTDLILDDTQSRITDANVIGDVSTPGNGPSTFENVTFKVDATTQAFSSNPTFTIEQGVELDDVTITQNGSQQARVVTNYQGTQTVSGTGLIDFVRDSGFGQSGQHTVTLNSLSSGQETLTIEEGITLRGHAAIGVSQTGIDRIKMMGTLVGAQDSVLTIRDLDNDGAAVTIDASLGTVGIGSWARETVFEKLLGSTGMLTVLDGTSLDDVTFAMDAVVDASTAQNRTEVYSGLTLDDATLALQGFDNLAELEFYGTQSVDGAGTVSLAANAAGTTNNAIRLNGVSSTEEVLTFGADITLTGTGSVSADDEGDAIRILGNVVVDGGPLSLSDIDNGGSAFNVNASGGVLRLAESVSYVALIAATGNTGFAQLLNGLRLEDIDLGIDARFEAEFSNQSVTLREGLMLTDSNLTLAGSEFATATLTVQGPQAIDGTGEIFLSDENAIDGRSVRNTVTFSGQSSDSEVFTIGETVTLRGTGNLTVSAGDVLDLQGDIIAEGGSLSLQGVSDIAGDIAIDEVSLINIDRDLSFADATDLTISLSGAGLDATAGLLNITGLLRRDGTLNLDIAADFDAEIGSEFEIVRTNGGFNIDGFDAVTGFVIDDIRSIALVESGNSVFARVVGTDQGGQQLTRADLPADPVLPTLNQNYTDQTLDSAFVGADAALITGGTWSNVDLLVDGFVGDGSQFVNWYVQEGLTVGGDLELTGSGRYAYMRLQGDQTVDGDGTIRLNDAQSYIYLQSLDSTARETVVFGPDLSIEGQGQIWTQRPEDWFQILGDVTAVGGALYLGDIDNGGETLSLDSAGGGWIDINRVTTNTVFDVAEGADVRITSGTHSDLTLGGAGATRIQNATVNGLTVTGEAEIEGTTVNASGQLYVNEDLTVDGTLGVAGTQQRTSYTYVSGEQTVDGSGEILLSRANAIGDEGLSGRNFVQLQSQFSTERETLTFGEDLTIRGDGTVTTNRAEDRIQILGDVAGIAGGNLILERIDNAGETLTVDATTGAVSFRSLVENTVVNGTGEVGLEANVRIEDVTFNMDARIGSATGYDYASVDDGLTLNAALELASGTSRYAYLYVNGAQTIGGTGSIDLTRTNAPSGSFNNTISLQSQSADAEVLTFGADIEITGTGRLEANRAEDSLQILGTVAGRDGSLVLTDIDNQGEVLTVDASDGAVVLSERIENTVFAAATGQTGELTIGSGAYLDAVTLNIDTAFGGSYPQSYVENGLTLNSDLEISANPNTYAYLYFTGEQVIGGTGTIRLSDANAPLSNNIQNYVYLNGQLSGSEIVTISADMEITGEGFVRSGNSLDEFLVEGAIVADNGTLRADDIAALEGILGATSDGDLFLSEGIELTERGTLAVGLSGSGADVSNGQIRITGALEQKGTLALDVATDFDAEIGDEFVFMTTTQGFTGAFDDFQGFDLAGDKAFELIQKDANTLAIRVTTDAVAEAGGFINRAPFVPEARPAFEKTDLILDDTQSRITDANVIGDVSTPGNGPSTFENVTFKVDATTQAFSSNPTFTIEQGVELDDVTITQNGSQQARVVTNYQGTQTVSGTGLIDFVRDSGFGQSGQHTVTLNSLSSGQETLTIEEGITLRGHAAIGVSQTGIDRIKMMGTLVGAQDSVLTIRDLDNDGAAVTIDASLGTVGIGSWARETVFEKLLGSTGMLTVLDGTSLDDVTFAMDAVVDASTAQNRTEVYSGLTLDDATLALQGFDNLAELEFYGTQSVDGAGTVSLAANAAGTTNNAIRLNGVSSTEEVLTFGADITLTGTGSVSADDEGDAIRILGNVVVDGGPLSLSDIDNGGSAFNVNASGGVLRLAESVSYVALIAATGNTGFAQLLNGLRLEDIDLGIDARFEAEFSNQSVTLREGLMLTDSNLTLAGSEFATATLTVQGPQAIDGTGEIFLSDENAIDGRSVRNTVTFSGQSSDSEVFTIGETVTLRGTGNLTVSAGDVLDLQGDIIAEGGSLSLQGVSDIAGDIAIDEVSLINIDRDLSFADATDLTISLSGAGLDATAGLLNITGLLRRDGTLNLDIAADFDAEIGSEFEIVRTNGGFNIDGFDAVTGFVIDDIRSIALVESGNSVFARVVGTDQGGQQLTRADLPADPVLPTLNQNYTDQTLDSAFVGADAALITGGTWSNVDLLVDGFVGDGSQFVNWYVQEGLTVGGDLELTGSGRYAYMRLQGDQTVDGDGTIRLNDAQSYIYLQSLDSTARETVVFGPDLSIEGQGQIWTQRPEDWFQILGDVTAVGGRLYLGDIDNGGETLSLDSAGGGWIDINRVTTNTVFDVAEGADVRITSGTHSDLTLGGAGATRIQNATVNGLTVTGEAEIEGTTVNASGQLYVNEDLTVDGTLAVAGTQQRASYTYIRGEQIVDGSGEILLSRANAIGDEGLSGRNFVQLQSQFSTERETLTFGEDLTIRGDGTVTTNRAEDRIQILGDVAGIAGGNLILERIDNAGETLTVDATTGAVSFRSLVENTVVNGTGEVGLEANVRIEDVTFNMDARIGSATGYDYASVDDGLTLNAALELASGTSRYAYLYVNGAQTIGGTGSIDLTRTNAPLGSFNNTISLQSQSADAEVLTFGADIEITGTGRLEANRAEDSLQILGTVAGRDGSLVLTDIDNQGEVLTVDASDGAVVLSERIENTVFAAATGQTGELTIGSGAYLDAVTLNIDTAFGGSYPQSYVENGLTLNSDLEISANPNTYAYLYFTGEQVIGGTGTIRLSDANAPLSNNIQNYVYLNGQLSGSEIVTISADMEITGEGFVRSGNSLDEFLVEGAIVADNGTLRADDIAALEGILGATSDGDLFLSEGIELTERGTLAVGLSGSGADVSNGQIRITGALEQKGTLALDVATDFDAEIGDEFVFMTTTQGFTGAFDDFQGFDLAGDKAFELIQKDANTLAIRVTTDAVAEAFNLVDDFDFGFV